ncbi:N-acetylmuramoyl-L-alanine amidase [Bradyrhizobium jicamae]|uniref:peptidoglycan recognition protein family protein n=1 Tax=Bradyrhizobium jicamae TaxID=280332 RepID=UPI001BAD544B|nr:N-acetylmuramoyl-L-alanine amidase [Bradyrhizobium jicamae]MBR0937308.1 N-acetylmuramoyl-L-alanine amidase [Bradyrhizobium jicamae]
MAVMYGVNYLNRPGKGAFISPSPVGCILHRPENPRFAQSAANFQTATHYPHFLVGKDGEIVQVSDTGQKTTHVGNANAYYIGIEISSIAARPGYEHRQDPNTTRDPLTLAQAESLRRVVDWVSSTHSIPKIGPPSLSEMTNVSGIWHGFCSHADVSLVIASPGDHEEGLTDPEFLTLGIFPSSTRHAESSMTELLRKLDRQELSPADRAKADALDKFLSKLGKKISP